MLHWIRLNRGLNEIAGIDDQLSHLLPYPQNNIIAWTLHKTNVYIISQKRTIVSPGCIPALMASTWVGVNGTAFLEKNEVTHIICEYTIQMFRHNRARGVGWKGRIFSAADVNCKIGLRHWPTNWSVLVLEKPGSCLVLFFYCLFAYPRDTIVRTLV